MKINKRCTAEPYSFLVNHATLTSDNTLWFRKNILKQIFKITCNKTMTIEYWIRDKKLQYALMERPQKYQLYHQAKLIRMNTLMAKKHCHLINKKQFNKPNLLILH